MTVAMGEAKAKLFADAHEAPYLGTEWDENCKMDLHNNEVGRSIGNRYVVEYGDRFFIVGADVYKMMDKYNKRGAYFDSLRI